MTVQQLLNLLKDKEPDAEVVFVKDKEDLDECIDIVSVEVDDDTDNVVLCAQ